MISYEEALSRVMAEAAQAPLPALELPLEECLGLALAADVPAPEDMPAFDRSAMDGYAVRSPDVASVPASLRVVAELPAGAGPGRAVGPGEAARIMTGAALPPGADAVVMVERSRRSGLDKVEILESAGPGENVRRRGEDLRRGEAALEAGTLIRPQEAALLAAMGAVRPLVRRRPAAAVLSTGDEVVAADAAPGHGQIRDANSHALAARLLRAGLRPKLLGIAPDREPGLSELLSRGLEADFLLISGGVSMGDLDLVPAALERLGARIVFAKVAMKPGRPALFARRGGCFIFGLPGNPVSVLTVAELLALPALRGRLGRRDAAPRFVAVELAAPARHKGDRVSFVPASLEPGDALPRARPVEFHGSADLKGLCRADALAVLPAGSPGAGAGERLKALPLDGGGWA